MLQYLLRCMMMLFPILLVSSIAPSPAKHQSAYHQYNRQGLWPMHVPPQQSAMPTTKKVCDGRRQFALQFPSSLSPRNAFHTGLPPRTPVQAASPVLLRLGPCRCDGLCVVRGCCCPSCGRALLFAARKLIKGHVAVYPHAPERYHSNEPPCPKLRPTPARPHKKRPDDTDQLRSESPNERPYSLRETGALTRTKERQSSR